MKPDETKAEWVPAMDRFSGPLIKYAMVITGDLERARDVVQETFVRLCDEEPSNWPRKVRARMPPVIGRSS